MFASDFPIGEKSLTLQLSRQARENLPILILVIAAVSLAIATNLGGFSRELLSRSLSENSAFASLLAVSFIVILGLERRELLALVTMISMDLIALDAGLLTRPIAQVAFGLVGLIAIFPRALANRGYGLSRIYFVIILSILLPAASTLALVGQKLTVYHVKTFDVLAYLMDDLYGVSASAILGQFTWDHCAFHELLRLIYGWLPTAVSTCYVLNVRAGNQDAGALLKAALTGGAIAFVLYHLYPAAGPIYAFGPAFPDALPDPSKLAPIPADLAVPGAPRNCMPSVHFVWAILALVESRGLGRVWRTIFALFAVLTAVATIALGEHYVIDLVVAVPFTLAVHALFSRGRPWLIGWRGTAVSGGVATPMLVCIFTVMDSTAARIACALVHDRSHPCRQRSAATRACRRPAGSVAGAQHISLGSPRRLSRSGIRLSVVGRLASSAGRYSGQGAPYGNDRLAEFMAGHRIEAARNRHQQLVPDRDLPL